MAHNFRELKIWINAIELVEQTYALTSLLPASEQFSLTNQISRSAVSIPSNIAEGSGRSTNKDFNNFLSISLSSSFELETQLLIANRLFGVDCESILKSIDELQKMIVGFKKSLN